MPFPVSRRASLRLLPGLVALALASCTGSENQVFTPFQMSGHGGTAGSAADASVAADSSSRMGDDDAEILLLNVGLDPDAQFLWTETKPGHPGACEAGMYAGSFQCMFDLRGGFQHLIGSLEITLGAQANSPLLAITDSKVLAFSGSSPAFSSSLDGELDCATAQFSSMTKSSQPLGFPVGFEDKTASMSIDGTFDGQFDAEALTLQGDVALTTTDGWKCTGQFHAQLSR